MTDYNDGKWHAWNGGDCPVHDLTIVEWTRFTGLGTTQISYQGRGPAKSAYWRDTNAFGPHVHAFRVVKAHYEPREFWLSKHNHHYILAHKPESNDPKDFIHVREVLE